MTEKSDFHTCRTSFVQMFGEDQATKIEEASLQHVMGFAPNVHRDDNWGTDPFRYHFMAVIAYECISREKFREHHGITVPLEELRAWALRDADLHLHDGHFPDYIGLLAGVYYPWINWEKAGVEPPEPWLNFESEHQKWLARNPDEVVSEMQSLAERAMRLLGDDHDWNEEKHEGDDA